LSLRETGGWRGRPAVGGSHAGRPGTTYHATHTMEQWLWQVGEHAPYWAIVGVLLITGFGVPIPEDLPILAGGYLSAMGHCNPWIMLPAILAAIIGADGIVFWLGRRYGHHIPKLPLLGRFLTEARLARTEGMLHRHGGKFIIMARFMPGIRTAAFFTAGVFKEPYRQFLIYDGAAALISAPAILLLAYFLADQIDRVKDMVADGQIAVLIVLAGVVALLVVAKRVFKRKVALAA